MSLLGVKNRDNMALVSAPIVAVVCKGQDCFCVFHQDPPEAVQRLLGQELNGICFTKANLNRGGSSTRPARYECKKRMSVSGGRSVVRRKRAEVEDDQALQEPKGIRIPRR
jgi:hypothetical protein